MQRELQGRMPSQDNAASSVDKEKQVKSEPTSGVTAGAPSAQAADATPTPTPIPAQPTDSKSKSSAQPSSSSLPLSQPPVSQPSSASSSLPKTKPPKAKHVKETLREKALSAIAKDRYNVEAWQALIDQVAAWPIERARETYEKFLETFPTAQAEWKVGAHLWTCLIAKPVIPRCFAR